MCRGRSIALLALASLCATSTHALCQASYPSESRTPWTRPELLDDPHGPKQALRNIGIDTDLWFTQFYQGLTDGSGPHNWAYGDKADIIVNLDGKKLGLWRGFYINVHQEFIWGEEANGLGGAVLPVNTAMAVLSNFGKDETTSLVFTQNFGDRVTLQFGKFNMAYLASKTPIQGGGGIDTFMNLAVAAPFTGVIPPYILGGSLTLKTQPATFNFQVYDPRPALESEVFEHPFAEGTTVLGSVTVPLKIAGRDGYHTFRGIYSNKEGVDFGDVRLLAIPPPGTEVIDVIDKNWYASYAVQQYLYQNPNNPSQGFGVFGMLAFADGNPNPLKSAYFIGIGGTGFLPGRELDRWGIAYFNDNISDELQTSLGFFQVELSDESGFEVFYNYALTPWFRVTANAQFIEPAFSDESAVFLGLRNQIKF